MSRRPRVAVIGAGLAGLQVAALLRRTGRADVIVLEASGRVSGSPCLRCPPRVQQQVRHAEPNRGIAESELAEPAPVGRGHYYGLEELTPKSLRRAAEWIHEAGGVRCEGASCLAERAKIVDAALRYERVDQELLGSRPGMPLLDARPDRLRRLGGSFLELLVRHRLHAIVPLLAVLRVVQRQSPLAKTSAYHGLLAHRPALLWRWLEATAELASGSREVSWMNWIDALELDVRTDARVVGLERPPGRPHRLRVVTAGGLSTFEADCTVVSIPYVRFVDLLERASETEARIAQLMTSTGVRSTRIRIALGGRVGSPDMVLAGRLGGPMEGELHDLVRAGTGEREWIVSQYDLTGGPLQSQRFERGLTRGLESLGLQGVEIIGRTQRTCSARFSSAGIRDRGPWRLLEEQGTRSTWFVGGAVGLHGVDAVLDHGAWMCEAWSRSQPRP